MLRIPSPVLPRSFPTADREQSKFNGSLLVALSNYLSNLATRANGTLPKDGSEPMTGSLVGTTAVFTGGVAVATAGGTLTVGSNITPIGANGSVVDSAHDTYATNAALTTIIPADDTIPTSSEGTQILTVTITPKATTNKLRCRFSGQASLSAAVNAVAAIYQGTTCIDVMYASPQAVGEGVALVLETEYTPGSLSAQTITVRVGPGSAGTLRMNGTNAARLFGGASNATLVVEEIKA